MQETVSRVIGVLCAVVAAVPIGTNLGLLHLLWMLVSGRLLGTRGAVIPGLSATGLSDPAVRRAWAALGQGDWTSAGLLGRWRRQVEQAGVWRAHAYEGYRPVAVDVTGFWRPRLQGCATSHYDGPAGKALPAIPVGIVARVGSVGTQRLGVPLAFVRAEAPDPSTAAHERALLGVAVQAMAEDDALVCDAGFEIRQLQEAGATRYVVRAAKNVTGRRARLTAYPGRGRPRERGELIRPLARTYRDHELAPTAPDHVVTWQEGEAIVRAEWWDGLVLPDVPLDSPTFRLIVTRFALDRAAGASHHPGRLRARPARPLPRPLAGRTAPAGGQANARRRQSLRLGARDLPAPPGAGAPGRLDPDLPRRHPARHPHRLLGSPPATHPGTAPTPTRPHRFPDGLPAARPHSPKSRRHRPLAQGLLGPTTPSLARPGPCEHISLVLTTG